MTDICLHTYISGIVVHPSSVTVFSGSPAVLTCQTKNINAHYIFWKLNGLILDMNNHFLPPNTTINWSREYDVHGDTGSILTIVPTIVSHVLVFQCVAGVETGAVVESENATLMVQGTVFLKLVPT